MKPAPRLLQLALVLAAIGLVASFVPRALPFYFGAIGVAALVAAIDAVVVLRRPAVIVLRTAPSSVPVGVWKEIELRVDNPTPRAQTLAVFDGVPDAFVFEGLPRDVVVPAHSAASFTYRVRAARRGDARFEPVDVLRDSGLRLWQRTERAGTAHVVRVFPDFATVAKLSLHAIDQHIQLMGLKRRQRRGEGFEFRQLRDYTAGDPLRRVDWKATSRRRKLISREYQEERDQQVLFVLDCGRRMRAIDGDLSHFDHCLNALLVVASVVLRQGDSVGFVTYGGVDRKLAPVKGRSQLRTLQSALYDVHPTLEPADHVEAAERVRVHQTKRALVLFVTNQRDDDVADLAPALELLRRRHLVVVASLGETTIDRLRDEPITTPETAATHCAAVSYLEARSKALEGLRKPGVIPLDTVPRRLAIELAHQYLEIKRSGRL
ncbi:MAG: DUF58 domain-containing protein [Planctomycetes bacterium]|nr:DUF58 domain-containing protein [Planctomycetota bacterium]